MCMLRKPIQQSVTTVLLTAACRRQARGSTWSWVAEVYLETGPLHSFLDLGLAPESASQLVPCEDTGSKSPGFSEPSGQGGRGMTPTTGPGKWALGPPSWPGL